MAWTPDWPRARRLALIVASVFAALALLAWLGLPLLLKPLAEKQLGEALGRRVSLGAVQVNPLSLSLRVEQLAVAAADQAQPPQLQVRALSVNVSAASLWRWAPVIESVALEAPKLRLARLADGHYDVDDILARLAAEPASPPSSQPARFALYNLRVLDGEADLDDRPVARTHQLRAVQLGLPFVSTLNAHDVTVAVEPRLQFTLDGTPFDTGAHATPFAQNHATTLSLRTGEIALAPWLPYLPAVVPLRPTQGSLQADVQLQFQAVPGEAPQLALQGQVALKNAQLTDRQGALLSRVSSLQVGLAGIEPLRRKVALSSVTLDGAELALRRDSQGRLNWLQALAAGPASAPAAAASAAASAVSPSTATAAAPAAWQFQVGQLTLKQVALNWQDEAVRPTARWTLGQLALNAKDLAWPLTDRAATTWQADAVLAPATVVAPVAAADAPGALHLEGRLNAAGGGATLHTQRWALPLFAPYLAPYLAPALEGQLTLQATARWQGAPGDALPQIAVNQLDVQDLRLREAGAGRAAAALEWPLLHLADGVVDLAARSLSVGQVALTSPSVRLRRDAAGELNALHWVAAAPGPGRPAPAKTASKAATDAPWRLQVQTVKLDGGRLHWQDAATGGPEVALNLTALNLTAGGLQWPAQARAPIAVQGSARVAADTPRRDPRGPGRIDWKGRVDLAAQAWQGQLRAERLPVHALAPYAGSSLPVTLARASADTALDTQVRWAGDGLRLRLKGDARLTDWHVQGRQGGAGEDLLSWQALALKGLEVVVALGAKPRVVVADASLADFYAALVVTEQGRFNLNDLSVANAPAAASAPAEAAPVALAAASAPAAAASAAGLPLDLAVGGVQLLNGRIDFNDHFIRPNYSAALSELNGKLGAFSSGASEMAALDLRGKVAGTAQLEISGAINPAAQPMAMDVRARATDLDLSPLSPYAAKYAGYAIERGKLSMNVSYRIQPDGQLKAENQIVLNQLTFGERVESPSATHLPVLLAVALLKDRNGVIDLNLPIGGSINDPQFSVGGVVVKLIVNLLTKALTAPFALLFGGGSDDLGRLAFQPGNAQFASGAEATLDKLVKALNDRPALTLTIAGSADAVREREAMQAAQLEARLLARHRQEAPEATTLAPEDRLRLLKRLYSDTKLPNKPRNMLGLAKDIAPAEMEALLKASFTVDAEVARELALRRGTAVRDALLARGLPNERLFLGAPVPVAADGVPGVALSLVAH